MTTKIKINVTTGSDAEALAQGVLDHVAKVKFNPTSIVVIGANGDSIVMKGTFTYDLISGQLNGGSITSLVLKDNGVSYAVATGDPLDALVALNTVQHGALSDLYDSFGAITFIGNDGSDMCYGGDLNDRLFGHGSDDTLLGYAGADLLDGGEGGDVLKGGAGTDTASYANSTARVVVSLASGSGVAGEAAGDTLFSIENLNGSAFNDRLTGNNGNNVLTGNLGSDVLNGRGGADQLIGGGGRDTAQYSTSAAAVNVNLATGTGSGGEAAGDTLSSIENVIGSRLNDVIIGSDTANVLSGAGGNDRLEGGLNKDVIHGGNGNDMIIGGQGIDRLYGDAGNDTFVLDRLSGNRDYIYAFESGADTLQISAADFGGGLIAGQPLAPGQLVLNTTGLAGDANDRFILNTDTGELFFDINGSVGGDSGSRLIAVFKAGIPDLVVGDFDIV